MTSSSSLYGTTTTQNSSSSNSTSLYGEAGTPIPDSSGNVVVRGDLYVLSGNILTTALTGNIFPANATTINIGLAATAFNLGANTGTTTVNNNLVVDGTGTFAGDITATGADFGDITIGVADDQTITTTSGELRVSSATGIVKLPSVTSLYTDTTGTFNLLNQPTTVNAFRDATVLELGESTGTTGINNNLRIDGTSINLAQGTSFLYSENNSRFNRPTIQSTSGNTSGLRVAAPNTGSSAQGLFSVLNSSDNLNAEFLQMGSRGSALSNTFRFLTGEYIAGVLGPTNKSISFVDDTNLYATVNPAGPTIGTDLTTKTYVDAQVSGGVTSITGTANQVIASSPTGAVTLSLPQSIATTSNVTFADITATDDLTVQGNNVNLAQATIIGYNENNVRANRPQVQSTTGNSSGFRVLAPNATTSATSNLTVFGSNDIDNGEFLSLQATGSTTVPFSIRTGLYTAGVLSASGEEINIADGGTTYATINPAGPTNSTDLTTKAYVDAIPNITYTIDATSATGGANFNLTGSDASTDTIKFAQGTGITVARTDANTITITNSAPDTNTTYTQNISSTTGGANLNLVGSDATTDTVKFANGTGVTVSFTDASTATVAIGQPVATTDAVTFASVAANGVNVGLTANTISGNPLALASNTVGGGSVTTTATDSTPGGGTGQLTVDTASLTYTHTDGALVPGVTGTWSFNPDGTTNFPSYKFPYADGTVNQVLTTDGAGNVTWALPGGGGSTFGNVSIGVDTDQTISTTSGNLVLQTAAGVDSGTITIFSGAGGNIALAPNGTGDIHLNSDAIRIGDNNATATLATRGTGDLVLTTHEGSAVEGTITIANGANGNITLAPNGTGKVVSGVTTMSDDSRVFGQLVATPNTAYNPPTSALTTVTGTNGIVVASSAAGANGNGAVVAVRYHSSDTTAGVASAAAIVLSGASGTNSAPGGAAANQVLGTTNYDGYTAGTSNNYASTIATTNQGAGTASIVPLQAQGYARQAFTNSVVLTTTVTGASGTGSVATLTFTTQNTAPYVVGQTVTIAGMTPAGYNNAAAVITAATTSSISYANATTGFTSGGTIAAANTVTAAGMGFRVRGYANSTNMTAGNRFNFMDLTASTATFKSAAYTFANDVITGSTLTATNYMTLGSSGHTMGNVDGITNIIRASGATTGTRPVVALRNTQTATAAPATGDGSTFRQTTAGSNGTVYNLTEIGGTYSSTGDTAIAFNIANGDQNTSVMTVVQPLITKLSSTTISATASPTATAGSNTLSTVAVFDAAKISASVPFKFPTYTAAAANAITGAVGWQISISNSPTVGGRMAFWDTTNARWSYISDNTAV